MLFAEVIDDVVNWGTANLPIVIGGAVALVLLLIALFSRGRKKSGLDPNRFGPTPTANAVLAEKAAQWAPPEQSYADRRGAVRREGRPVRVFMASSVFKNGMSEGYVLDRSTGGLRIAVTTAVPPNTLVQVRAANAPDNVGFVTIVIRSCRPNDDFYELGCEFESTPPWNVLLLFG